MLALYRLDVIASIVVSLPLLCPVGVALSYLQMIIRSQSRCYEPQAHPCGSQSEGEVESRTQSHRFRIVRATHTTG